MTQVAWEDDETHQRMAAYTCLEASMKVKVHTSISRHNTVHARWRRVLRNRPLSRKMDAISCGCGGRTISCECMVIPVVLYSECTSILVRKIKLIEYVRFLIL